jgi:hypothetical protein
LLAALAIPYLEGSRLFVIADYDRGGGKSTNPADDLRRATNASPVLAREAPEAVAALLNYPKSQPAKATERFFWVNFEIDGQPTIALTHRLVTPQDDGTFVLADRHYVSRSHNAVQAIGRKIIGGQIAALYEQLRARSKR